MCPLATTASLSALASEKAANPGFAAGTVHVGQRGVALNSNRYYSIINITLQSINRLIKDIIAASSPPRATSNPIMSSSASAPSVSSSAASRSSANGGPQQINDKTKGEDDFLATVSCHFINKSVATQSCFRHHV